MSAPPPGYNPAESMLQGGTATIIPVMGGGGISSSEISGSESDSIQSGGAMDRYNAIYGILTGGKSIHIFTGGASNDPPPGYNATNSLLHGGEDIKIHAVGGGTSSMFRELKGTFSDAELELLKRDLLYRLKGVTAIEIKKPILPKTQYNFIFTTNGAVIINPKDIEDAFVAIETAAKPLPAIPPPLGSVGTLPGPDISPFTIIPETGVEHEIIQPGATPYAIRKVVSGSGDWGLGRFTQGEVEFLTAINLTPEILSKIFPGPDGWYGEVATFLTQVSESKCFLDASTGQTGKTFGLDSMNCAQARAFVRKVFDYFMTHDIRRIQQKAKENSLKKLAAFAAAKKESPIIPGAKFDISGVDISGDYQFIKHMGKGAFDAAHKWGTIAPITDSTTVVHIPAIFVEVSSGSYYLKQINIPVDKVKDKVNKAVEFVNATIKAIQNKYTGWIIIT